MESRLVRILRVFSVLAVVALFSSSRTFAAVGSIPGEFSVSPSGAATYSIPIEVPPGIGGMQPQLSLEYSSQSGNGLVGIGWSLGGLSAITRCPATIAQDGYIDRVDMDENDKFCLDGQRLIAVNGVYGANGTEYRTEIDTFSRIVSYGQQGNVGAPLWFEVQTKSGLVMEYGNSYDSRPVPPSIDVVYWGVNKITDTNGNFIRVQYQSDLVYGPYYTADSHRPSLISYTNNVNGAVGVHTVEFVYEQRADVVEMGVPNSGWRYLKRLKNILVNTGSVSVSSYSLHYDNNSPTGESRLTGLDKCDSNNQCVKSQSYIWTDSTQGFLGVIQGPDFSDASGWVAQDQYSTIQYPDLDGDGMSDICSKDNDGIVCYINDGQGFSYSFNGPNLTDADVSFPVK